MTLSQCKKKFYNKVISYNEDIFIIKCCMIKHVTKWTV